MRQDTDFEDTNYSEIIYRSLLKYRNSIFGFSILLVVLYHWCCDSASLQKFFLPFINGAIGCDIFFFLSAFGLCFSLNKYTIVQFYKRRVLRIYPLFILLNIYCSIVQICNGAKLDLWDWFCNLSGLSYYGLGGSINNWFISSLILLYFLTPGLYKLCLRLGNLAFYIVMILAFSAIYILKPDWPYESFIARIPLYILGILYYNYKGNLANLKVPLLLCLVFFQLSYNAHEYFMMLATFMPVLLLSLIVICNNINNHHVISYIGSKSLEIFFGNIIARGILRMFDFSDIETVLMYIPLNILFSTIMIFLGMMLSRLFNSKI